MKKENKEKVVGGDPSTTSAEKNFQNRKGLVESKLKGILAEQELGMRGQLHMTPQGIIPIIVFVDEKPEEEEQVPVEPLKTVAEPIEHGEDDERDE